MGGGGGAEVLNRTNYLFHLRSAIFYLIHTLPQAKYLFHFLRFFFQSTNLDPKVGLVLKCGQEDERKKALQILASFNYVQKN